MGRSFDTETRVGEQRAGILQLAAQGAACLGLQTNPSFLQGAEHDWTKSVWLVRYFRPRRLSGRANGSLGAMISPQNSPRNVILQAIAPGTWPVYFFLHSSPGLRFIEKKSYLGGRRRPHTTLMELNL